MRMTLSAKNMRQVSATEAPGRRPTPVPRLVTREDEDCSTAASSMAESCDEPSTPALAASYRVLPGVAGAGIVGEVRRCVHLPTAEECAVKTIVRRRVRRTEWRRLDREVAFLREVDHPNIVAVRDVYEDADEVHIVTELCRGGELFDHITERALWSRGQRRRGQEVPACFCEEDAVRVLRSLLEAVAYLHDRDIVHRDIKPENILFVDEAGDAGAIKLIDFGLAARHRPGGRPLSSVVGTAYYLAPEVLAGSYDRACDLWSVGVVAYTLLAGRPPFHGPTNDAIFDGIRAGRYRMEGAPWRGVSAPARDFVRRLLATKPGRRMTAAAALEHPWLAVDDR